MPVFISVKVGFLIRKLHRQSDLKLLVFQALLKQAMSEKTIYHDIEEGGNALKANYIDYFHNEEIKKPAQQSGLDDSAVTELNIILAMLHCHFRECA
ncbi:hypothetical protein F0224_12630 [Vibrio coralliilyticus]|uniref:hypothetical protein n=1 Tax=Vibrio coralliilyticus TaxID=190893 RepID=UPI0011806515|nr:hypothetical protein [Vibrio coralliilyticus]NOI76529.1 hypothetical protein [Vibrio coralliilyticus]